ncbi:MAG: AcsA protein [Brevibacillus sp.]|nr:AcsA protein [Brevibacillus sp.]
MEMDLIEKSISFKKRAEQIVFCDLINALLQENLAGFVDHAQVGFEWMGPSHHECRVLQEGEQYFRLPVDTERSLLFHVKIQSYIQPYKISRFPVLLLSKHEGVELDPITFMQAFAEALSSDERESAMPNLQDFQNELRDSIQHTALSLEAMTEHLENRSVLETSLVHVERFSALRDRPFHPTSRAKRGWSDADYQRYSPEYGGTFGLDWVGVRRDHIQASADSDIADFILNESEKETLRQAVDQVGVNEKDYLLFPVHPWQMEHILPTHYHTEMKHQICVPIIRGLGEFRSTSSVRSMVAASTRNYHVKVPIGIYSLGALRLLPPRYLNNGAKGQKLLHQVMEKDKWLQVHLRLCDETKWWGYHDPAGDPFSDKPGHLACLIREYPLDLLDDPEVEVIPMSALTVVDMNQENPVFAQWLAKRFGDEQGEHQVLALFREVCSVFIGTSLRLFRYGIMPEIHGQNVMLIIRNHHVTGLLLRDHDTIRLHLDWMEKEGVGDPAYVVKPGAPNSLINETPEQLLAYFQTLGVQVNLYAIADALITTYSIEEAAFWAEINSVILETLLEHDFPSSVRKVLEAQLLASEKWPIRLLLTPLLKRIGTGGGSMPAGVGTTSNPIRSFEEQNG